MPEAAAAEPERADPRRAEPDAVSAYLLAVRAPEPVAEAEPATEEPARPAPRPRRSRQVDDPAAALPAADEAAEPAPVAEIRDPLAEIFAAALPAPKRTVTGRSTARRTTTAIAAPAELAADLPDPVDTSPSTDRLPATDEADGAAPTAPKRAGRRTAKADPAIGAPADAAGPDATVVNGTTELPIAVDAAPARPRTRRSRATIADVSAETVAAPETGAVDPVAAPQAEVAEAAPVEAPAPRRVVRRHPKVAAGDPLADPVATPEGDAVTENPPAEPAPARTRARRSHAGE